MNGVIKYPNLEQNISQYIHYGNVNAGLTTVTVLFGIVVAIFVIIMLVAVSEGGYLTKPKERRTDFFATSIGVIFTLNFIFMIHVTGVYYGKQAAAATQIKNYVTNQIVAQEPSLKDQFEVSLYGVHSSVYTQEDGPVQIKLHGTFWNGKKITVTQVNNAALNWTVN